MDTAQLSVPISVASLIGGAYAFGVLSNEVKRLRGDIAELRRDAKDSAKDQGTRIGGVEDKVGTLMDWKLRTEAIELGRSKEREDTRGIPAGGG